MTSDHLIALKSFVRTQAMYCPTVMAGCCPTRCQAKDSVGHHILATAAQATAAFPTTNPIKCAWHPKQCATCSRVPPICDWSIYPRLHKRPKDPKQIFCYLAKFALLELCQTWVDKQPHNEVCWAGQEIKVLHLCSLRSCLSALSSAPPVPNQTSPAT